MTSSTTMMMTGKRPQQSRTYYGYNALSSSCSGGAAVVWFCCLLFFLMSSLGVASARESLYPSPLDNTRMASQGHCYIGDNTVTTLRYDAMTGAYAMPDVISMPDSKEYYKEHHPSLFQRPSGPGPKSKNDKTNSDGMDRTRYLRGSRRGGGRQFDHVASEDEARFASSAAIAVSSSSEMPGRRLIASNDTASPSSLEDEAAEAVTNDPASDARDDVLVRHCHCASRLSYRTETTQYFCRADKQYCYVPDYQQLWSSENPQPPVCVNSNSEKNIAKSLWPIVVIWFSILTAFLFCSIPGRNAIDFVIALCFPRWNDLVVSMVQRRNPDRAEMLLRRYYHRFHLNLDMSMFQTTTTQRAGAANAATAEETTQTAKTLLLKTMLYDSPNDRNNNNSKTLKRELTACSSDASSGTESGGEEGEGELCCTICFAPVEHGERVGALPCNHHFHVECLKVWLKRRNVCPLCLQADIAQPRQHDDAPADNSNNNSANNGSTDGSQRADTNDSDNATNTRSIGAAHGEHRTDAPPSSESNDNDHSGSNNNESSEHPAHVNDTNDTTASSSDDKDNDDNNNNAVLPDDHAERDDDDNNDAVVPDNTPGDENNNDVVSGRTERDDSYDGQAPDNIEHAGTAPDVTGQGPASSRDHDDNAGSHHDKNESDNRDVENNIGDAATRNSSDAEIDHASASARGNNYDCNDESSLEEGHDIERSQDKDKTTEPATAGGDNDNIVTPVDHDGSSGTVRDVIADNDNSITLSNHVEYCDRPKSSDVKDQSQDNDSIASQAPSLSSC